MPPAEREALLETSGGDAETIADVRSLLAVYEKAPEFLTRNHDQGRPVGSWQREPAWGPATDVDNRPTEPEYPVTGTPCGMRRRAGRAARVLWAMLALGGTCWAQPTPVRPSQGEGGCFPDVRGAWTMRASTDATTFRLTPAQAKLFRSKIEAIAGELSTLQVFNPPLGFSANVFADFCCTSDCEVTRSCAVAPVLGRLWLNFLYFVEGRGGEPVTDEENRTEAEVRFNNPYAMFDAQVARLPDGRKVALEPVAWRRVGGITLYFYQSRTDWSDLYVFLTKGSRPLWIPVTREQFLTALLREREAEQAKQEAEAAKVPLSARSLALKGVAMSRAMLIDPLRQQLERMSGGERASQAWTAGRSEISPLVPAGAEGARPLVAFNPDYLDRSRPRTDIQLIVVRLEGVPLEELKPRLENCSDVSRARLWEFVNQVDWGRLAAAVE